MKPGKWTKHGIMLVCVLFSTIGQAASVQSRIEYYDVGAHDMGQLRAQINNQGPEKQGRRYSIAAEYSFTWTARVQVRDQRCEALEPDLELTADLIMPRWISQSKAEFGAQQSWISYIAAAQQYHQQITRLIEQSAGRFVQQTRGLNAPECEKLEALINAKGRAALANAQQKIRTYQRKTRYGRSLGLTVP
ncbi:DUF922 domain-containing protein [Agarivorans sp. MS3-6]|uniref:DUF922 domain-containing protein n=1 Tax=Agarivorans sp. TSD2052 TaxID=2937286 RepID=UPI00200F78C8|nr:DUF922 domain-containing protein [Agarivorans sp. TSD2052]UPW16983.1 DUF922 domain-containing Zn-dependent protease [Agarivorans sp. TSD2052]